MRMDCTLLSGDPQSLLQTRSLYSAKKEEIVNGILHEVRKFFFHSEWHTSNKNLIEIDQLNYTYSIQSFIRNSEKRMCVHEGRLHTKALIWHKHDQTQPTPRRYVMSVVSQRSYQLGVPLLLTYIFLSACDFVTLRNVKMSMRAADSPIGNNEKQKRKHVAINC